MNIGTALESLAETSMLDAVVPPTRMCVPVVPSIPARSSRSLCTRSVVASSFRQDVGLNWSGTMFPLTGPFGPDFGINWISAVWFCAATAVTCATSGSVRSFAAICWVSAGLAAFSTVISSAPLKPAPKASVVRS